MKKFRLIYLAATALLFAACANEDEGGGSYSPVAAIVHADISQSVNTRVNTETSEWTIGDAIGVYVLMDGNTKGTNVKYVAKDVYGNFSSDTPIYFMDDKEQSFGAYYPYQAEASTKESIAWHDGYVGENGKCDADFLFAKGALADKETPEVSFTNPVGNTDENNDHRFKHIMSMLHFTIYAGNGIYAAGSVLKSITLKSITRDGIVVPKDGNLYLDNSVEKRDFKQAGIGKTLAESPKCAFVLLPQDIDNGLNIEFVVSCDGIDNVYKATLSKLTKLNAGYKYSYDITVLNTSIVIDNSSIQAWENGGESSLDVDL